MPSDARPVAAYRTVTRRAVLRGLGAAAVTAASGPLIRIAPVRAAPAAAPLRFGVQTPQQHVTYDDVRTVWLEAEDLGLDTAFVFDHFLPIFSEDVDGPCFEGWTLLSALAAKTDRIQVGVLVTGNTYRYPAVLAKMAATVEHVSEGRLILGMGAGWFEREHRAYDIPFYTAGERARRLVESVEVVKRLFTEERVTYDGKYYDLQEAPFAPKAVGRAHPPILIGGMGPRVIQPLAARHADIWHFFVRSGEAAEAQRINAHFDSLCRDAGRDPAAVERAVFMPREARTAEAMRAHVEAFSAVGVQHFILGLRPPYDRDLLRVFATEVVPAFREGAVTEAAIS